MAEQGAMLSDERLEYVLDRALRLHNRARIRFAEDVEIARQSLADADAAQFAHRRFSQLSSGERQRVALARSLAQQPRCCCSTSLLPTRTSRISSLLDLVRNLTRERNHGALIVTHEINLAAEFADPHILNQRRATGRLRRSARSDDRRITERIV